MNFRRPVNAEEATIPLRTVVVIMVMIGSAALAAGGVLWSARGQWDDTQRDIRDLKNAVVGFNQTVIDRSKARDKQIADLGERIDNLATQQNSAHDETMQKIAEVDTKASQALSAAASAAAQATAAAQSMARFKCQIFPKNCEPKS